MFLDALGFQGTMRPEWALLSGTFEESLAVGGEIEALTRALVARCKCPNYHGHVDGAEI